MKNLKEQWYKLHHDNAPTQHSDLLTINKSEINIMVHLHIYQI
jgi:hypothetical protein